MIHHLVMSYENQVQNYYNFISDFFEYSIIL